MNSMQFLQQYFPKLLRYNNTRSSNQNSLAYSQSCVTSTECSYLTIFSIQIFVQLPTLANIITYTRQYRIPPGSILDHINRDWQSTKYLIFYQIHQSLSRFKLWVKATRQSRQTISVSMFSSWLVNNLIRICRQYD